MRTLSKERLVSETARLKKQLDRLLKKEREERDQRDLLLGKMLREAGVKDPKVRQWVTETIPVHFRGKPLLRLEPVIGLFSEFLEETHKPGKASKAAKSTKKSASRKP